MIFMSRTHSQKYLSSINLSFNLLIRFTGDVPLKQITPKITQSFLSETYERAKKGASLYCRTLKASFKRAIEWNYLEENPFVKVRLPKIEKSFPVFITESELEIILGNTPNKILKDLFFTAFHTEMRRKVTLRMVLSFQNLMGSAIIVIMFPAVLKKPVEGQTLRKIYIFIRFATPLHPT